ncbi:helix-turn-helix domain-containing protein [Clostridium sp. BL-8]|uniref:TetR/AcrR family transcriptional regulator n=1 Tax=Clostridium sp. BL-8 TaxID=349938 RepID=UPI00098CDF38|nr:helix-turn-helix domain-containing protein [Clostridium sp. BL-8]OOM81582.1 putative HTH-type transcriptional regulator YttP [Clostridium sp. BL-8]
MNEDRKSEILEMSRQLFNEQGYNNVSMRNIADAINISVGNLTYYFKKKEDLIEAVILEQNKNFSIPKIPTTLIELNEFFIHGIQHQKNNSYYYRHFDQLAKISPQVYQIQVSNIKKRHEVLQSSFTILQKSGFIIKEEIPEQINGIIEVLNLIKIYWMPSNDLLGQVDIMTCFWSIIYPILTEKGKVVFREEIQEKISKTYSI